MPNGLIMARLRRIAAALLAGLACSGFFLSLDRFFLPEKELWPLWDVAGAQVTPAIDHAAWDRWLSRNRQAGGDGIARIDYAAVSLADRADLTDYVAYLQQVAVRDYPRDRQRAYWINLYNAATVLLMLKRYPVESIRDIDISPGWFAIGPWDKPLLVVEGQAITLNDIEHRILRPIWDDSRLHYALNCAALGCPDLPPVAFTAENTEALLDAGARAFINHPRGARVADGRLYVSSIYRWFSEDFGDTEAGVIAHLRRYAAPALAQALAGIEGIADDDYDWRLNDAAQFPVAR